MRLLGQQVFYQTGPGKTLVEELYNQTCDPVWDLGVRQLWNPIESNIWTPPDLLSNDSLFRKGEI